ncbi:T9SS type A sorting domain-containing protein [Ignavibacteria bacterium 4148-Me]|uniref:T9SS type A sorting domain-containing protein n=1 Tax=Rosettibacter primus TaxID=3111523 RepID=UPI00336C06CC
MKKLYFIFFSLLTISIFNVIFAQQLYERKVVKVPKVAPGTIKIDGKMDEAAWQRAAQANLITSSGYEIYTNQYYRDDLTEPDYDEYYARMLWTQDTLYVFIHIDEIVNDSTNLFWAGKWTGDQLFVSISNRLGIDFAPEGRYNGNVFTVPDGPYHFLILGDQITLNGGDSVFIPEGYRRKAGDTTYTRDAFDAKKYARMAAVIDTVNGIWDVELAIYNPSVTAQSKLGFNIGGSTGSRYFHEKNGDAYAYYCWQPNVPDQPYTEPPIIQRWRDQGLWGDPGTSNLATSQAHAVLVFEGDNEVYVRKEVEVPLVEPNTIKIDGKMDEAAWQRAAQANLITSSGYEIYTNQYYRDDLTEPDYDEYYARMLWTQDTLYVFIHIDEIVNDSTNLFWAGKWTGDQLFVSISNRLGIDFAPEGRYNGNVFTVPDGPYHFLILGDQITLNGGDSVFIPKGYRRFLGDTVWTRDAFDAKKYARMAAIIDTVNGVWDVELAIYNPSIAYQSALGFNIGGSTGSRYFHEKNGDAYAYYCWQPNVPDQPYTEPPIIQKWRDQGLWGDPGTSNLATSQAHAVLNFVKEISTSIKNEFANNLPISFALDQNYPNPFNPSTTIRFHVSNKTKVSLKIYNTLGQLITTLVDNQILGSGTYLVTWNPYKLASGVYFYSLEADGKVITKKMMYLK